MEKQAFNPYLPAYEYVPDGEPRVFGERLYIFGSHDAFDGDRFCTNDYVCWSAPVNDPTNWCCHGIIYRKDQDPLNTENRAMYAPDVVRGTDGRYYLYYTLDFLDRLSIAVANSPEGPYDYYGVVAHKDGSPLGSVEGDVFQYDPGLLVDDDGRVHLYSGVAPGNGPLKRLLTDSRIMDGSYHFELASDMRTVVGAPHRVAPGMDLAAGTPFEDHAFFEASSIRKLNGRYYFIYSSSAGHELCYATCDRPDGDFQYGGTLVSIGDVGLGGRTEAKALNYYGNTHGSIASLNGTWYVFYHRHTNGNQFSRQGCAEKIEIAPDGSIAQVEITSCGLNGGDLRGEGWYSARIACNLSSAQGVFRYRPIRERDMAHPYFTQENPDNEVSAHSYIANMRSGSWAGFKYFHMNGSRELRVRHRGSATGHLLVSTRRDTDVAAVVEISPSKEWLESGAELKELYGHTALYFKFEGSGSLDFKGFTLV